MCCNSLHYSRPYPLLTGILIQKKPHEGKLNSDSIIYKRSEITNKQQDDKIGSRQHIALVTSAHQDKSEVSHHPNFSWVKLTSSHTTAYKLWYPVIMITHISFTQYWHVVTRALYILITPTEQTSYPETWTKLHLMHQRVLLTKEYMNQRLIITVDQQNWVKMMTNVVWWQMSA